MLFRVLQHPLWWIINCQETSEYRGASAEVLVWGRIRGGTKTRNAENLQWKWQVNNLSYWTACVQTVWQEIFSIKDQRFCRRSGYTQSKRNLFLWKMSVSRLNFIHLIHAAATPHPLTFLKSFSRAEHTVLYVLYNLLHLTAIPSPADCYNSKAKVRRLKINHEKIVKC